MKNRLEAGEFVQGHRGAAAAAGAAQVRALQDLEALRLRHLGRLRRVGDRARRRARSWRRARRLRRHGGHVRKRARRPRRRCSASPGPRPRCDAAKAALAARLHAADRHARQRRLPPAGGAEPAAPLLAGDARRRPVARQRRQRLGARWRTHEQADGPARQASELQRERCGRARRRRRPHESAHLHVAGEAPYIDDMPELAGTLHAALGPVAAGARRIEAIDLDRMRALPGVVAVLLGAPTFRAPTIAGRSCTTTPSWPTGGVQYLGQPVFAVIGETRDAARRAAAKAGDVHRHRSRCRRSSRRRGARRRPVRARRRCTCNAATRAAAIDRRPAQARRHASTSAARSISTSKARSPTRSRPKTAACRCTARRSTRARCSTSSRMRSSCTRTRCRSSAGAWAAASAARSRSRPCSPASPPSPRRRCDRPVKLRLDRDDDFLITGHRHCFHYEYEVGYDDDGRVLGAELTMVSRAGFSADLSAPVMTRAICHFDNAYWLPDVAIHGYQRQDQHAEQHRVSRLRRPAGRDRDRDTSSTRSRARWARTRSTCARPTSTASASATSRPTTWR